MLKRLILLTLVLFSVSLSEAQIRKYTPKSEKDGFVRFVEFGGGAFVGGIKDHQFVNSEFSIAYGASINAKLKFNRKHFAQVSFNKSLKEYDRAMLGNFYEGNENDLIYDLLKYPIDNPLYKFDPYEFYLEYDYAQFMVTLGYYAIGSHKSKFAFAPVCPSFAYFSLNTKMNYLYEQPLSTADFSKTTSTFQIANTTTMHYRFNRINVFMDIFVFSALSRDDNVQVPLFEELYKPKIAGASATLGLRYRL